MVGFTCSSLPLSLNIFCTFVVNHLEVVVFFCFLFFVFRGGEVGLLMPIAQFPLGAFLLVDLWELFIV